MGNSMLKYAVRKRRGQWTICADEHVLLDFRSYDEALATARSATQVLAGYAPGGAENIVYRGNEEARPVTNAERK
jgi:hypothetical protein